MLIAGPTRTNTSHEFHWDSFGGLGPFSPSSNPAIKVVIATHYNPGLNPQRSDFPHPSDCGLANGPVAMISYDNGATWPGFIPGPTNLFFATTTSNGNEFAHLGMVSFACQHNDVAWVAVGSTGVHETEISTGTQDIGICPFDLNTLSWGSISILVAVITPMMASGDLTSPVGLDPVENVGPKTYMLINGSGDGILTFQSPEGVAPGHVSAIGFNISGSVGSLVDVTTTAGPAFSDLKFFIDDIDNLLILYGEEGSISGPFNVVLSTWSGGVPTVYSTTALGSNGPSFSQGEVGILLGQTYYDSVHASVGIAPFTIIAVTRSGSAYSIVLDDPSGGVGSTYDPNSASYTGNAHIMAVSGQCLYATFVQFRGGFGNPEDTYLGIYRRSSTGTWSPLQIDYKNLIDNLSPVQHASGHMVSARELDFITFTDRNATYWRDLLPACDVGPGANKLMPEYIKRRNAPGN